MGGSLTGYRSDGWNVNPELEPTARASLGSIFIACAVEGTGVFSDLLIRGAGEVAETMSLGVFKTLASGMGEGRETGLCCTDAGVRREMSSVEILRASTAAFCRKRRGKGTWVASFFRDG